MRNTTLMLSMSLGLLCACAPLNAGQPTVSSPQAPAAMTREQLPECSVSPHPERILSPAIDPPRYIPPPRTAWRTRVH
ncbi:MAG TPA: hypothetical protein VGQ07_05435 [Nitrospirales bacterium]|jgi:hypothetical protein|nr:hypothetical protein [Nitrospirales bacterium]